MGHLNEYSEAAIEEVNELTGYGIAYTGMGHIGFYKLLMKFGEQMKFVTKIELNQRPRPSAACFVDYTLDYYFGKVEQK